MKHEVSRPLHFEDWRAALAHCRDAGRAVEAVLELRTTEPGRADRHLADAMNASAGCALDHLEEDRARCEAAWPDAAACAELAAALASLYASPEAPSLGREAAVLARIAAAHADSALATQS